jgi:hypothetical protein
MEYELYKSEQIELTVNKNETTTWEALLKPDFGIVTISDMPSGVKVQIDGKGAGGEIKLNPGTHHVQFNGGGVYADVDTIITITANQTVKLNTVMIKLVGSIKVMPVPMDAEIAINGKSHGTGAQVIDSLPIGVYTIACKRSGFADSTQSVEVKAGETQTVMFTLTENGKSSGSQQKGDTLKTISADTKPIIAPDTAIAKESIHVVTKPTPRKKYQLVRRIVFGSLAVIALGGGLYFNNEVQKGYDEQVQIQREYDAATSGFGNYTDRYDQARSKTVDNGKIRNGLYGLAGVLSVGFIVSIPF